MKTVICKEWANRTMNLIQPLGEVKFDADGKAEMSDENAQTAISTYANMQLEEGEKESEAEKEKKANVNKIMKIKKLEDLKDLASAYEEDEIKDLKTVEDYKNFLVSKL